MWPYLPWLWSDSLTGGCWQGAPAIKENIYHQCPAWSCSSTNIIITLSTRICGKRDRVIVAKFLYIPSLSYHIISLHLHHLPPHNQHCDHHRCFTYQLVLICDIIIKYNDRPKHHHTHQHYLCHKKMGISNLFCSRNVIIIWFCHLNFVIVINIIIITINNFVIIIIIVIVIVILVMNDLLRCRAATPDYRVFRSGPDEIIIIVIMVIIITLP